MRCRKVRKCLGVIHQINISIQRNMTIICFCFYYAFRSENELLGGTSHIQHGTFSEDDVTEIIHNNRRKFEPFAEIVDETYENVNAELVDNQDAYGQIENVETITASYNENETEAEDSENSSANLYSVSLMPEISPDNEIAGITRSLNEKQRMVFNLVHMRSRIFHQKFVKKKMFYHSSNSNISVRQWRYRKVSSNKNYLPGCFKTITLSCQRSIETLCCV